MVTRCYFTQRRYRCVRDSLHMYGEIRTNKKKFIKIGIVRCEEWFLMCDLMYEFMFSGVRVCFSVSDLSFWMCEIVSYECESLFRCANWIFCVRVRFLMRTNFVFFWLCEMVCCCASLL